MFSIHYSFIPFCLHSFILSFSFFEQWLPRANCNGKIGWTFLVYMYHFSTISVSVFLSSFVCLVDQILMYSLKLIFIISYLTKFITAPFNNTWTLKVKTQLTIVFFTAKHFGSKSTNHNPRTWPFEPSEVNLCFLRRPLRWLTAANQRNRWLTRVRSLLKGAVTRRNLNLFLLLFSL